MTSDTPLERYLDQAEADRRWEYGTRPEDRPTRPTPTGRQPGIGSFLVGVAASLAFVLAVAVPVLLLVALLD